MLFDLCNLFIFNGFRILFIINNLTAVPKYCAICHIVKILLFFSVILSPSFHMFSTKTVKNFSSFITQFWVFRMKRN